MDTDQIYYYLFNSSEQIKQICENFDFNLYRNSLESNNIDCFNEKNLLYYSRENLKTFFAEGLTLPYCICLPLYCIVILIIFHFNKKIYLLIINNIYLK